jgi:hypothetical protein
MLSWLRRSGRLVAPFAIVLSAMVLMGTADWRHANDSDDFVPAAHDHASHHPVLKAARATGSRSSDHCYLCHWLRSFQNGLRTPFADSLTRGTTTGIEPLVISAPRDADATRLSARAPPA